jgi:hypothetical protein
MLRRLEGVMRRLLVFNGEDKISNVRLKKLTGLGDINKGAKKKTLAVDWSCK